MPKMGFSTPTLRVAFVAFNKHIATEIQSKLSTPPTMFEGSDEQQAIWHEAIHGNRHIIVNAVAGSGKTSTALQYCHMVKAQVDAMTYHSLGFKALKKVLGPMEVDQYKVDNLLERIKLPIKDEGEERTVRGKIKRLVSLSKQYGRHARESLEWIIDYHDLDMNGDTELVLEYTPIILAKCIEQTRTVDFDDMVWLPQQLKLDMPKYDVMITDEAQDLNAIQQWCALQSSERHIVIGDKNQAIYSFRGASSNSMDNMKDQLTAKGGREVVELTLNFSRRCPKAHIAMAQRVFGGIQALDEAPEGKISHMDIDSAIKGMKVGDLVLCRVNADLLSVAYKLLKRKVPAVVRGRDIGEGLKRLIEKCEKIGKCRGGMPIEVMLPIVGQITSAECKKFDAMANGRGAMRAQAAQDRAECLVELGGEVKTTGELKRLVDKLFADEDGLAKTSVVLGTIHRTKGLEAHRVWILRPELIPHPMAKRPEEFQQEKNAGYISVTRAKYAPCNCLRPDGQHQDSCAMVRSPGEIVFVGKESPLFMEDTNA